MEFTVLFIRFICQCLFLYRVILRDIIGERLQHRLFIHTLYFKLFIKYLIGL